MGLPCLSLIPCVVPIRENFFGPYYKYLNGKAFLVKVARFWQFNDLDFIVNHNNGKTNKQIKKNWPIWAMDTSCLFTNAYVSVPQVSCFLIGHGIVNTTSLFIIISHCFTVRVSNQLAFRVRRADHDSSLLRFPFPHLSPSQPKRDFHSCDMHKL